ncbi:DUF4399 domain-containing protein [Kangiella sp. HZ709]|uniref:DUF4399 domain-containing protein n=1 Tax=Kangiella sp. HZ709 TaxID=2666328 RepID=UPI0012B05D50|nr:DUF4399 domain-containing protein [Kangiella sp. HZ709]MRX28159.1 DUF4399 domain-containing protein [Kangiella sp. HZ709]
MKTLLASSLILLTTSLAATASPLITEAAENAEVYFISPNDGDEVNSTFKIVFGLSNMGVAPAGVNQKNTGHHHLLVNLDELPNLQFPLPATDQVIHFGGGQTETEITLEPGTHTLQLLMGNFAHVPHKAPVLSKKITITVQ